MPIANLRSIAPPRATALKELNLNMLQYAPVLALPMQEGAGLIASDISGFGNHGALGAAPATPTWVQLPNGLWYLFFDGAGAADDLVTITASASIANIWDGGGTAMAWLNPGSDGEASAAQLFSKSPGTQGWIAFVSAEVAGKMKVSFVIYRVTTGGQWTTTATALSINTWSFFALTYNADDVANNPIMYINTTTPALTEVTTPAGARKDESAIDLIIGNRAGTDRTWDGGIALPRKIKRVILTPAQLANIYNQEKHYFGLQDASSILARINKTRELAAVR